VTACRVEREADGAAVGLGDRVQAIGEVIDDRAETI
jgi:hypothetical protein